ncbi:MAG: ankyrin repeat domain-containing protein, partial [Halanaerobiales bacterium]
EQASTGSQVITDDIFIAEEKKTRIGMFNYPEKEEQKKQEKDITQNRQSIDDKYSGRERDRNNIAREAKRFTGADERFRSVNNRRNNNDGTNDRKNEWRVANRDKYPPVKDNIEEEKDIASEGVREEKKPESLRSRREAHRRKFNLDVSKGKEERNSDRVNIKGGSWDSDKLDDNNDEIENHNDNQLKDKNDQKLESKDISEQKTVDIGKLEESGANHLEDYISKTEDTDLEKIEGYHISRLKDKNDDKLEDDDISKVDDVNIEQAEDYDTIQLEDEKDEVLEDNIIDLNESTVEKTEDSFSKLEGDDEIPDDTDILEIDDEDIQEKEDSNISELQDSDVEKTEEDYMLQLESDEVGKLDDRNTRKLDQDEIAKLVEGLKGAKGEEELVEKDIPDNIEANVENVSWEDEEENEAIENMDDNEEHVGEVNTDDNAEHVGEVNTDDNEEYVENINKKDEEVNIENLSENNEDTEIRFENDLINGEADQKIFRIEESDIKKFSLQDFGFSDDDEVIEENAGDNSEDDSETGERVYKIDFEDVEDIDEDIFKKISPESSDDENENGVYRINIEDIGDVEDIDDDYFQQLDSEEIEDNDDRESPSDNIQVIDDAVLDFDSPHDITSFTTPLNINGEEDLEEIKKDLKNLMQKKLSGENEEDSRPVLGDVSLLHALDSKERFERLLNLGADVNETDEIGRNALHYLCNEVGKTGGHHLYLIRLLVENGVDVNCRDEEGNTPLHLIHNARGNAPAAIKYLKINGARLDIKNNAGFTPYEEAERRDERHLMSLLIYEGKE